MSKMNPEVKEKLVAALRSGEYKKGTGRLFDISEGSFCIVGVICDLHSKETGQKWEDNSYLGEKFAAPKEVVTWVGIGTEDGPVVTIGGETRALMGHNDNYDNYIDFNTMADVIENQL